MAERLEMIDASIYGGILSAREPRRYSRLN